MSSFAYDGNRIKKWNKDPLAYGEAWSIGDIIGTLIDFDRKEIKFYRNQKSLGRAFTDIPVGPNIVYFPAISLQRGNRVVFNFGKSQLYIPHNNLYGLLEEPMSHVHNYNKACQAIIDCLKSFVITFWEYQHIAVDQRLAVGSVLVEYLFPLILDDYLMEEQLLQFFYEVTMIKKNELRDLIFDMFEMNLSGD
jgi:Kip1 ubiquitination-promoting complex protein 1